ncbi:hypothetical protein J3P77_05335 [Pseudomonas sp. R1-18]
MCITMFKKGHTMNNKSSYPKSEDSTAFDLSAAVEDFVSQGGVISVIPQGGTAEMPAPYGVQETSPQELEAEKTSKLELLKGLVAKGAGVSALQYSLRMNKKEIRQLATDNGVKISYSRPVKIIRKQVLPETSDVDDVVAGHAMHYSSLGYTVPEIAQVMDLSVRQVWDIGKAYRFQFRQNREPDQS